MKHTVPLAALVALIACASGAPAAADAQATPATQRLAIARRGSQPTRPGPAATFTGTVRVEPLFDTTAATRAYGATVHFAAGARTAWHTHPRGQVLIVTAGVGRAQLWGDAIEEIRPGDVVRIPPGAKHWHGAAPAAAMSHIAIVEPLDGRSTDWMEKVTDAQYGGAVRGQATPAAAAGAAADSQPSAAQRIMGDIAPKLAELTDSVLFGDVWARPGLSQRDRSLVTVSALIAMNRPDQLRSHMGRALANGVTREELIEAITHLAFYAGWPSAVTAVGVAREVLPQR